MLIPLKHSVLQKYEFLRAKKNINQIKALLYHHSIFFNFSRKSRQSLVLLSFDEFSLQMKLLTRVDPFGLDHQISEVIFFRRGILC